MKTRVRHTRGAGYQFWIAFEPPIDNFHKTHLKGENRGVQVKKSQIDITWGLVVEYFFIEILPSKYQLVLGEKSHLNLGIKISLKTQIKQAK